VQCGEGGGRRATVSVPVQGTEVATDVGGESGECGEALGLVSVVGGVDEGQVEERAAGGSVG